MAPARRALMRLLSTSFVHSEQAWKGAQTVQKHAFSSFRCLSTQHPPIPPACLPTRSLISQQRAWAQFQQYRQFSAKTTASSASSKANAKTVAQKNRNLGMYMVAVVTGMLGFTYFSVPLYRMFCAATGYGGTVAEGQTVEDKLRKRVENPDIETEKKAAAREVTVTFASEVQPGLNWTFQPCQRRIKVRPGQSTLVFYTASNNSQDDITGVSTYNVTPGQVGVYFNKIQCFCFEEQRLRPGETVDMPIFFYIDPEFATDRRLHNVDHVTLSYVFFKTGELPTHDDGTPLEPGASMPAHLLPSNQALIEAASGKKATPLEPRVDVAPASEKERAPVEPSVDVEAAPELREAVG